MTHSDTVIQERGQWGSKIEFFLAMAGNIIGLGNVWRFPYLCYKNGGGVFLVPYVLFLFTCGIPLFLLETSLGQYTNQGGITCWRRICPLFEGLGYGSQVLVLYASMYYIIILAWAFFYLFSSFNAEVPWASCRNTWNTDTCMEFGQKNKTDYFPEDSSSPVIEFWERRVLGLSKGIEEMGTVRWELALCLLLCWIICYFCIWRGVVYFTATFPYVMLLVLLIRGLTLPGAKDGIVFYLYPEPSRLADPQVWLDAGSQILYSYGLCGGSLTALGSYNKYDNNCYKDCFYLCLLNSGTSFVAGFAIFSVLGFMAYEQDVDIAVFVNQESLVTAISDMYPSFFQIGHRRKLLLLLISVVSFFIGLVMVTEGGLYVFLLFDYYACSGLALLVFAIFESVCVGWVYGAHRLYDNIEDMIGYRPWPLIKYCWLYVTPFICLGTFIASLARYTPLTFDGTYEYPWWGYAIGGLLTLSSTLMVPLWMGYAMAVTPGVEVLCTPAAELSLPRVKKPPTPATFETFTEMCTLRPGRNPGSSAGTGVPYSPSATPTSDFQWV
ncbi:hypothetical protein JZ751_023979 [Albula glossodonta]|uniref:Transporter n=1 Tax=Albula glossodonta TaxID=121402 RepID=A0A8T2NGA8_9TELE|nr:hypothetical protein JZ751_023979 [Albula glossodonta]